MPCSGATVKMYNVHGYICHLGATGPSVTLSRAGHPLCGLGGGGPWGGAAPNSESVIVYNCIIIDSSCIVESTVV